MSSGQPPPLPDLRRRWIVWFAVVIGGPLLALCGPFAFQRGKEGDSLNAVLIILVLSLILHLVATIFLAKDQASFRKMSGLPAGFGRSFFSLLILGWAVMLGVFFAGCTIAMSIATVIA